MRRVVVLVFGALALAACARAARPDYAVPDESPDPAADRLLETEERAATRQGRPRAGTSYEGLTRRSLDETLAQGPGAFLGTIRVRAVQEKKVFRGWTIISLWPGARTELLPGDVVTRLCGRTLEKPDDVSELWGLLRTANEIVVEYERAGEPRVYRVPVVE